MNQISKSIVIAAAIIGASIVAATAMRLICNRFTVVKGRHDANTVYVVNNITGSVKFLVGNVMHDVKPKAD